MSRVPHSGTERIRAISIGKDLQAANGAGKDASARISPFYSLNRLNRFWPSNMGVRSVTSKAQVAVVAFPTSHMTVRKNLRDSSIAHAAEARWRGFSKRDPLDRRLFKNFLLNVHSHAFAKALGVG